MKNIVIFASGEGSNAENLMLHFQNDTQVKVAAVFCNNSNAGVLVRSERHNIPVVLFAKEAINSAEVLRKLEAFRPSLIVLAGFLLHFPTSIIERYRDRIVNIHPALLPKFGGKGMYGMNVHRAVLDQKEKETGVTIHYVDEHYDQGDIIFQKSISLVGDESPEMVAAKVQKLEQEYFPQIIESLIEKIS